VLSVHCSTEAGTRSGGARPNQDAFGVVVGVTDPRFVLATLLDGHGAQGHFLARHVRDRLPAWVASCVVEGETPRPSQLIPDMRGFSQPPPWMLRAVGFLELDAGGELRRLSEGLPPLDFPPSAAQLAAAFLLLDADMCNRGSALLEASRVTCLQSGCAAVAALVGDGTVAVASCGDSSAYRASLRAAGHATGAHARFPQSPSNRKGRPASRHATLPPSSAFRTRRAATRRCA